MGRASPRCRLPPHRGGRRSTRATPQGGGPLLTTTRSMPSSAPTQKGATVYDTSDVYGLGHSLRLLGRILAQVPVRKFGSRARSGPSEVSALTPLNLHSQAEQSLENLGVEYLGLLTLNHTDFGPHDCYLEDGCHADPSCSGPQRGSDTNRARA
ncbi:aldo/keto reductase [Streptomyces sp. NBC_01766]|uniref:aldo/keto reductase n=1 Tax=Streptomyces sp. NBC_01766 TaxID=2975936 RepID=UPI003FA38A42